MLIFQGDGIMASVKMKIMDSYVEESMDNAHD